MYTATRTEITVIKPFNSLWEKCDKLSFLAKNLRNSALYEIRQHYFNTKEYLHYFKVSSYFTQSRNKDYYALPTKVSQTILRGVDSEFKSFFGSLKSDKVTHRVSLPKYSDKLKGRHVVPFNYQTIKYVGQDSDGLHNYVLCPRSLNIPFKSRFPNVKLVRIVPHSNYYTLECVYDLAIDFTLTNNTDPNIMGIDLGVNNFATFVTTKGSSGILNGKPIKSINQYYNKRKASLQKKLPKGIKTSKAIKSLTTKRNFKMSWELHNLSRLLVNYAVSSNVITIVIGHNAGWKQNINIGKKNNQTFTSIPFYKFIEQVKYKAEEVGIEVLLTEESYTSKSSFLDNDPLPQHTNQGTAKYEFSGKRIKRGLYESKDGTLLNADCNAALNIIRKVAPNTNVDGVEGVVVRPSRVTVTPDGSIHV